MNFDNIKQKHLVIFGDSNTFGYNPISDGRFGIDSRYPCLLADHLGTDWRVYEEGLCGRTSVFEDPITEGLSGLDTISPILSSHAPVDKLIIMLGTNDTKARFSCNANLIAKGLRRLVIKAMHSDCWRSSPDILLICPPPIDPAYSSLKFAAEMGPGCDFKSLELAPTLEMVAEELQIKYLNAGKIPGIRMHELDGMHLTADSHRLLAEKLKEFF